MMERNGYPPDPFDKIDPQKVADSHALDCLIAVIMAAKSGLNYKALLPDLRNALDNSPAVKQAIRDSQLQMGIYY